MLCFVLVTALMAKSHLVVRAEQAWVLKIWLWPSVAEKVSPSKVLHYCKQSLQSVSHFQSFHNIGVFQHSHGVNVSKSSLILEKLSFVLLMGSIFVLLMGLLAITPGVVRAKQAWGLRVWLWPPVSEKYLPR